MYFFYSKKEYKTIIYIIISIACALLIGTKSAYIAVYASLILSILVMSINFIITKKINIIKLLIISLILITLISINNKIYAFQFMNKSIDYYSYESEDVNGEETLDVEKFVLNGRQIALEQVKSRFNHEDIYTKIVGLGFYYPRYPYSIIEMDLSDILYKHGIIGISAFLATAIYYISKIINNIIKNFKKINIDLILPLSSIGMVTFASVFSGHVMFHYITIFFYSFIIVFLYSKTSYYNKTKKD